MEENERLDNIEELEPSEAIEPVEATEPTEEQPEAATELGGLVDEVREELPAEESSDEEPDGNEEDDDDDDDDDDISKPVKIGFGAWLAAIAVFLFALAVFVPALWNTQLSISAITGLTMETQRRYSSASAAYAALSAQDQAAQQWAAENFSFGSSETPVFSSGNFVLQRFAFLYNRLNGPYALQQFMMQSPYFNPEGTLVPRYPRYLKPALAKVDLLDEVSQSINDAIDLSYREADPETQERLILEAIDSVKKSNTDPERALLYDAIKLDQVSYADPASKETGKLIAALKKTPGSEHWMYVGAEYARAQATDDYAALADIFDREFSRNREDYSALASRIKALHLAGDTNQAQKLIKKYNRGDAVSYIQVFQAELLIREGKYKEAVKFCDTALKAAPGPLSETTAQTVEGNNAMELVAQKSAALLLQGDARQALNLLRTTLDAPYGDPSPNYLGTTLAAAVLADDAEYLEWLSQAMLQSDYAVPEEISKLQAKTITLEEIYTEGWGGF